MGAVKVRLLDGPLLPPVPHELGVIPAGQHAVLWLLVADRTDPTEAQVFRNGQPIPLLHLAPFGLNRHGAYHNHPCKLALQSYVCSRISLACQ
jgi:hypothetical protein